MLLKDFWLYQWLDSYLIALSDMYFAWQAQKHAAEEH
jgi:hypothetical protein